MWSLLYVYGIALCLVPVSLAMQCDYFGPEEVEAWKQFQTDAVLTKGSGTLALSMGSGKKVRDLFKTSDKLFNFTESLMFSLERFESDWIHVSDSSVEWRRLEKNSVDLNMKVTSCTCYKLTIEANFSTKTTNCSLDPIEKFHQTEPINRLPDIKVLETDGVPKTLQVTGMDPNCPRASTNLTVHCQNTGFFKSYRLGSTQENVDLGTLCPAQEHTCVGWFSYDVHGNDAVLHRMSNSSRDFVLKPTGFETNISVTNSSIKIAVPPRIMNTEAFELVVGTILEGTSGTIDRLFKRSPPVFVLEQLDSFTRYRVSIYIPNTSRLICRYREDINITTGQGNPSQPPEITSITPSQRRITLIWTWPSTDTIRGRLKGARIHYTRICRANQPKCSSQSRSIDVFEEPETISTQVEGLEPFSTYQVSMTLVNEVAESIPSPLQDVQTLPIVAINSSHLEVTAVDDSIRITIHLSSELYFGNIWARYYRKMNKGKPEGTLPLVYEDFRIGKKSVTVSQGINFCTNYVFCVELSTQDINIHQCEGACQPTEICHEPVRVPDGPPLEPHIRSFELSSSPRRLNSHVDQDDKGCTSLGFEYTVRGQCEFSSECPKFLCQGFHVLETKNISIDSFITINHMRGNSKYVLHVRAFNAWGMSPMVKSEEIRTPPFIEENAIDFATISGDTSIEVQNIKVCPYQGAFTSKVFCNNRGYTISMICPHLIPDSDNEVCVEISMFNSAFKRRCVRRKTGCTDISPPLKLLRRVLFDNSFNPYLQIKVKLPAAAFNSTSISWLQLLGANGTRVNNPDLNQPVSLTSTPDLLPGQTYSVSILAVGCKNSQTTPELNVSTLSMPQLRLEMLEILPSRDSDSKGRARVNVTITNWVGVKYLPNSRLRIGVSWTNFPELFPDRTRCLNPTCWHSSVTSEIEIEFDPDVPALNYSAIFGFGHNEISDTSDVVFFEFPQATAGGTIWGIALVILALITLGVVVAILKLKGQLSVVLPKKLMGTQVPENGIEIAPLISQTPSRPIPLDFIPSLVENAHFDPISEFASIQTWDKHINSQFRTMNEAKRFTKGTMDTSLNRYSNIVPYDDNRVVLKTPTKGVDYVNASWVENHESHRVFIAAQGPLLHTCQAFWQMILDHDIGLVVMLTRVKERGLVKCHQYWPGKNWVEFGPIRVEREGKSKKHPELSGLVFRDFRVSSSSTANFKIIRQIHYLDWPDHGVPEDPDSMLVVRKVMDEIQDAKFQNRQPILVHCSAGVGRTGTLIGLDHICRRIQSGETTLDIQRTVCDMRKSRCHMVQQPAQYHFLYKAVAKFARAHLIDEENAYQDYDTYEYYTADNEELGGGAESL